MARVSRWSRSPVVQFALSGLLAVALLGLLAVGLVQRSARAEALRDAKELTRLAGEGIVAPALTPGVLTGDSSALARLDRVVRTRALSAPFVRVKLWSASGRILYSDEPRLIGERYRLGAAELRVLRRSSIEADVSDLTAPENRFERNRHRLREVYLGIPGPDGRRLLFETYLPDSSIAAGGRRIWRAVAPILLGALLVLELSQIPLATSLARRLSRGQLEREALLRQAVAASELERRRIARDLHDGVVQDLAGVSYELSAANEEVRRDPAKAEHALRDSGLQVRHAMRRLRTLLVDLYPDGLHREGLEAALSDLLAGAQAHGMSTDLVVAPDTRLGASAEALVLRAAQEALRNVTAHAHAGHVAVRVSTESGSSTLEVADDGRGFAGPADARPRFGLRMLEDAAREAGGTLEVRSQPGAGTTLRVTLPSER